MAGFAEGTLRVGAKSYRIHRLAAVEEAGLGRLARLPRSIRVLLENLLRHEDGVTVVRDDIAALAAWRSDGRNTREIAYRPARVVLQDLTGVPAVVDLAAMRDAMTDLGGDPKRINPLRPADLVIDHSVQVDFFGSGDALAKNAKLEFERNTERFEFLRWGQSAFSSFRVVPPATGIVHQVNLEYLAPVVFAEPDGAGAVAYPDTVVGTDSHTTMIGAVGVVGWGVGGIEAEACLLGQPLTMLIPDVVGFELTGRLPAGATATDLVLTITQTLRKHGVVEKFVEFFGPGMSSLAVADRATIANMAPEYGATIGFFPVDEKTIEYLRLTGRSEESIALVEAYWRAQGMFADSSAPDPEFGAKLTLDLSTVVPCLAGPSRPQDRVALGDVASDFARQLPKLVGGKTAPDAAALARRVRVDAGSEHYELASGSVVIAAITSCTNTSNPSVLTAAGLLARNAVERGLDVRPWVKTSLAPGSRVVADYLAQSGLLPYLEKLGFHIVGYGCTTCIGNSGPLPKPVSDAIGEGNLVAAAVLSGNRNFEGRISPLVRANYLASPPLVVAYALAGRVDLDLSRELIGVDRAGKPVLLAEIWPGAEEVARTVAGSVKSEMFRKRYADVFLGDESWRAIRAPAGDRYAWSKSSTYIRKPPFFDGIRREPRPPADIRGARVLALLGDSVTTDHISPAGSIATKSPAGRWLVEQGVAPDDFNSYGARRGNYEVMVRGTFANTRIKNLLAPGTEGGVTTCLPEGDVTTIFEAAERYARQGTPLVVIAGAEYGTGSSRDWAAKGTMLLGVRAVIATSFERIHRSNLVGMGVLPLEFAKGETAASLGLTGRELYDIEGLDRLKPRAELSVRARDGGAERSFRAVVRIDTPRELEYFEHGGILPYVLRQLA
ncbi:MAG: aconitate hydratase AcnA [Deltaproteobacteria bacterium]|nr:aconitate hydratase AcnA [Deltaproteobacteria bacterium]